ncbi:hypothetical protein F4823DRAFT_625573 [Ustulina deusta]|nr:hypothetical protein F4823DRAFT_625573 [Ustulina deusta]
MRPTNQHFHHRKQSGRLFLKFFGRWLITVAICGARAYLEDNNTNVYNVITAGLTIVLSLNLDASLNAFVAAFKWIFDLILEAICVAWLLISLGAQVSTALIGLTYAVSPLSADRNNFPKIIGDGSTAIFAIIGFQLSVNVTDLESETTPYNLDSQRSTAFAFGIGAGDDYTSSFHSVTFDNDTRNYVNIISNYPQWKVESYAESITFDGNNGTQVLIVPKAPLDYTTYISDTNHTCGPRYDDLDLFLCNSTGVLSIPDTQARILAGAIGWGDLDIDSSLGGVPTIGRFYGSKAQRNYDEYGPWAELSGIVIPGQASELDLTWGDVISVLTLIPAFQAMLGLICICVVYYFKVHVHDDSPLAMAKLLAPTISRGPNDNLHCGEESRSQVSSRDGNRQLVIAELPCSYSGLIGLNYL